MTTTDRRYYTGASAAKLLQVSPSTVWRRIAAGRLPAQRLGPKTIRTLARPHASPGHRRRSRRHR